MIENEMGCVGFEPTASWTDEGERRKCNKRITKMRYAGFELTTDVPWFHSTFNAFPLSLVCV